MAVLSRDALEGSPLADLHLLARELGIDGFRRLRKADLVEAIIARQGGEEPVEAAAEDAGDEVDAAAVAAGDDSDEEDRPRRSRRGGRRRRSADEGDEADEPTASADEAVDADTLEASDLAAIADEESDEDEEKDRPARRSRGGRGGRGGRGRSRDADGGGSADDAGADRPRGGRSRDGDAEGGRSRGGRSRDRDRDGDADRDRSEDEIVEGTVELLGNGSGFLRVSPPDPSDDDVYISAAQIRRCELVSGDRVAGPVRAPRRSERYPSLVRIDTINGSSADEVAEGTPYDELPCTFPTERLALGSDDPTLKAIEWLTPLGRGSRATIIGGARAGKTEALRRLAGALAAQEDLELSVVLAGVRPEEVASWRDAGVEPTTVLAFSASPDAQAQAIERAVDTAKRVAARGANAVVLVDTLSYVDARSARRILSAARNIVDGGSLTVVATADLPVGGETTVIALDPVLTSTGRFPALDLVNSGALRSELLVGEAGADAITQARAAAVGG
ncbi:MAG TPA: Rho termination factor N-terminal domain-containing protein [Solirubrobacteraceae bacterium]|jgi:transcription termination factor Rho